MHKHLRQKTVLTTVLGLAALAALVVSVAAQGKQTISATARIKTAGGVEASAPVTVVTERLSTDADRDELMAALKKGGTEAVRSLLLKKPVIGSVQIGQSNTAIKYAYARTTPDGRLITAVTDVPIAFVGAGLPGAQPKAGFDLGLVLLDLSAKAPHGELAPATKIKTDAQGAIVTEDYSGEMVQLTNVAAK